MKKYLFTLITFVAVLTSCSNDDINIRTATNFRINPATVVSPFSNAEWTPGDLESFDTGYQLRVRLLVYNLDGLLQAEDVQYFNNYSVIMNSSISLPEGRYIAVAITDVMNRSASAAVPEYWTLYNYERLADAYIEDQGYIGAKNKILGLASREISVSGSSQNEISINVDPAGSLLFVLYGHIHQFDDVESYYLSTSKIGNSYIFNTSGSYEVSSDMHDGDFDWYLSHLDVADYESTSIYSYHFIMPVPNMNVKFRFDTVDGGSGDLTDAINFSPRAGEAWYFEINLSEWTFSYDCLNDVSTKSVSDFDFDVPAVSTNKVLRQERIRLTDAR